MKRNYLFLITTLTLLFFTCTSYSFANTNINGNVTYDGSPVCSMVLANGQYMFTCSGDGSFNLDVPLDSNGEITVYSFCSGLSPYKKVISPSEGTNMQIQLEAGDEGTAMDVSYSIEAISSSKARISGNITYDGSPVCAMALANGQYMFTCSGDGSFDLEVPFDSNGEITLYGFCSGLPPYKELISPKLDTSSLNLQAAGTSTGDSSLVMSDNTFELDDQEIDSINESENTIILSSTSATYNAGDILIGTENTRFVKKIVTVDDTQGRTILHVEDAAFDEIFEEGELTFEVTPDWSQGSVQSGAYLQKPLQDYFTQSKIMSSPSLLALPSNNISPAGSISFDGISLFNLHVESGKINWDASTLLGEIADAANDEDSESTSLEDSVSKSEFSTDGEIKATITQGRLHIIPTTTGKISNSSLDGFSIHTQMDMLMTFDATLELELNGNASFEFSRPLLPKIIVPVTIPATPPVHLDIELELPVSFTLSSSVTGKASFQYHSQYAFKVEMGYTKANDEFVYSKSLDNISEEKSVDLTVEGSIDSKLSLQPTVTVKLYKIFGPFITLEPYIQGTLSKEYNVLTNMIDWTENQDDLYLGMSGFAGLSVKLIGLEKTVKTPDLFDIYLSWDLVGPLEGYTGDQVYAPESISGNTLIFQEDGEEENYAFSSNSNRVEIIDLSHGTETGTYTYTKLGNSQASISVYTNDGGVEVLNLTFNDSLSGQAIVEMDFEGDGFVDHAEYGNFSLIYN